MREIRKIKISKNRPPNLEMIKAKKHLGQNFLKSQSIIDKIIKSAKLASTDVVIEIGPGLGILTQALAKEVKKIIAIELDASLIPILKQNLNNYLTKTDFEKIEIRNADALKFDPKITKYKIVANIPYYITSPLITHFLTLKNPPQTLTLLVQKEVANKICARTLHDPKEKHSILSLQTQLYAKPTFAFTVSKGNFIPQPKVDSAVIHLEILPKSTRPKNPEKIIALAKKAFSGKRKKLSTTLKGITLEKALMNLRPEDLLIDDWVKLTDQQN